jgi:hypothetical protein
MIVKHLNKSQFLCKYIFIPIINKETSYSPLQLIYEVRMRAYFLSQKTKLDMKEPNHLCIHRIHWTTENDQAVQNQKT